jgi:hypothetical protein
MECLGSWAGANQIRKRTAESGKRRIFYKEATMLSKQRRVVPQMTRITAYLFKRIEMANRFVAPRAQA